MIDPTHELSIVRQAQVLDISRSSTYYTPQPVPEADLALMRIIDRLHLEHPFAGARMLRDLLRLRGFLIGRKHVATLMRMLGIEALYRKANTSKRHPGHKVYPYLLRGMQIERANQVWAMDMTYIPMAHGFVYLTAVLDWATRRVLAWRLSNSMAADACADKWGQTRHIWYAEDFATGKASPCLVCRAFTSPANHCTRSSAATTASRSLRPGKTTRSTANACWMRQRRRRWRSTPMYS